MKLREMKLEITFLDIIRLAKTIGIMFVWGWFCIGVIRTFTFYVFDKGPSIGLYFCGSVLGGGIYYILFWLNKKLETDKNNLKKYMVVECISILFIVYCFNTYSEFFFYLPTTIVYFLYDHNIVVSQKVYTWIQLFSVYKEESIYYFVIYGVNAFIRVIHVKIKSAKI